MNAAVSIVLLAAVLGVIVFLLLPAEINSCSCNGLLRLRSTFVENSE